MLNLVQEALSWQVLTQVVRREPSLRIHETHPGGGMYDCLALFSQEDCEIADLNRRGSFHVFTHVDRSTADDDATLEPWAIWEEIARCSNPTEIVDGICKRIGVESFDKSGSLPPSTPRVLSYRFIAEFLSWTMFRPERWSSRSGFHDSSGLEGSYMEVDWFKLFPCAADRVRVSAADDFLRQPAYRFWFITRDNEPMICLETTGTAWNLNGDCIDIPATYKRHRKIWPLILKVAEDLLP